MTTPVNPMTTSTPPAPTVPNRFDASAATWDDDPAKVERARAVADAILREVKLDPAMRALELGAGTGLLGFMLRPSIGELTLADVSDGMLAVAAAKIAAAGDPRVRAVRLDLVADPLPAERFDLVFSLMTLHHIPDTDAVLRRLHDVLAPSGTLCIADLDAEDGSFHGAGFDGHHGFDRVRLGAQARAAGFATVAFTTAYVMRKASGGVERSYPIFLLVATA